MADRPITFSGPMVRALLAGTKTQTRRVMNPQPYVNGFKFDADLGDILCHNDYLPPATLLMDVGKGKNRYTISDVEDGIEAFSRIKVGDRLYVREHWRTWRWNDDLSPSNLPATVREAWKEGVTYIADDDVSGRNVPDGKFRQAMHMPKWASRITLHVTEVRVQRLEEITEADAIAEGIVQHGRFYALQDADWDDARMRARDAYADLWKSLHGSWDGKQWVTATTFEVERCHIDQARAA